MKNKWLHDTITTNGRQVAITTTCKDTWLKEMIEILTYLFSLPFSFDQSFPFAPFVWAWSLKNGGKVQTHMAA